MNERPRTRLLPIIATAAAAPALTAIGVSLGVATVDQYGPGGLVFVVAYDGQHLIAGSGERLRDEVDLATIRADMLATIDRAVRPSSVGGWLRSRSGDRE